MGSIGETGKDLFIRVDPSGGLLLIGGFANARLGKSLYWLNSIVSKTPGKTTAVVVSSCKSSGVPVGNWVRCGCLDTFYNVLIAVQ
ncbi:MAG: hypothetical protein COA78_09575 [Blastopirellula sp.]|nr:MAG: hypothetical protein COA78_09575 [Blastopirellula sp.]